MSKELEALLDLFNEANRFNNEPYKFNTLELFERKQIIEQALKRLEAIDNSNPSEALKELELVENWIRDRELKSSKVIEPSLVIIKQALLKAQEPKQYLKWEDLEKFKDKDSVKVKMNDTELSLIIQIDCLNDIYVQLYKEKEDGNCVNLLSDFFRNKELFNNLRLELLE